MRLGKKMAMDATKTVKIQWGYNSAWRPALLRCRMKIVEWRQQCKRVWAVKTGGLKCVLRITKEKNNQEIET